ncbi:uncharacterized protein LOC133292615 [Gastrolobium bilobum]|uniref:uncharacterized protein LOC133292615 n=1 Tax=Gastrolobium bilobum TaxID=150636 RepID=UPI002AAF76B1|nr:uncharacterized protein LOC133292615 [Gastrolobium bilobum]
MSMILEWLPESAIELRKKLADVTHELEIQKNANMELFNVLNIVYEERDEARSQLQELMNKIMLPTTQASQSHDDFPVRIDSSISTRELSNNNNIIEVDYNNNVNVYINPHMMVPSEEPKPDPATSVIESLAKGRALPQRGQLEQAVKDAGPLLQSLLTCER